MNSTSTLTLHDSDVARRNTERLFNKLNIHLHPLFLKILFTTVRELIIIGGWRAGKSTLLAAIIFSRMFRFYLAKQPGLFWLVAAQYPLARQEFLYIKNWSIKLGMVDGQIIEPQQGSWVLTLHHGIILQTVSAEHEETIASVAPDLIGVCEAGQCSDLVRLFLQGRAMEKRAMIIYSGTLEDDTSHAQWAWYPELATQWLDGGICDGVRQGEFYHDCATEHYCYSLPSWINTSIFPGGEEDEEIQRRKQNLFMSTGSNWAFLRYIAAVPNGIQMAIYEPYSKPADLRLMTQQDKLQPQLGGYGGVDYGTGDGISGGHPSAVGVATLIYDHRDSEVVAPGPRGILWVREISWALNAGDTYWLLTERKRLAQDYSAWTWNVDPNEKLLANLYQGEAVSYAEGARMARAGLLVTRFKYDKIRFDLSGPGVEAGYKEIMRVHRKRSNTGQLIYDRTADDRAAVVENIVQAVDGKPMIIKPSSGTISFGKPVAGMKQQKKRVEYSRIR
jgi:hypothetical protein